MHELGDDGRLDLYVYNEATAWTLSSRRLIEEQPASEDEAWDAAVAEGRLIAQMLHQDDAFNVRIVLGELTEEEDGDWIGRASWWLQVPDGNLVVAAGGEFSWGWTHDYEDYNEFVHDVAIPPGNYQVDILTTLSGVNGLPALGRTGHDEPLGAWWRRTRPDEPIPSWLAFLLYENLAQDPGHDELWRGWHHPRFERMMRAVEHGGWIDWIIQLRPLEGPRPTDLPELDEGCFYEPELRVPPRCPPGIAGTIVNAEEHLDENALPWDVPSSQDEPSTPDSAADASDASWDEDSDDFDVFAALAEGAIPLVDPLHEATSGRAYFDIDDGDIPDDVLTATDPLLRAFEAAGAVVVGNVMGSVNPNVLMRGVADKQARWYGIVMVAPFVGTVTEAYTTFADGSSLTTTTNPFPGRSVDGAKIHWNPVEEDTSVADLVAAHATAVAEHEAEHGTTFAPVRQNLLGLCEAIEAFLVRRMGR